METFVYDKITRTLGVILIPAFFLPIISFLANFFPTGAMQGHKIPDETLIIPILLAAMTVIICRFMEIRLRAA
jgi:hypothetical protein